MRSASADQIGKQSIAVRKAKPSDLCFVRDLCQQAFAEYGSYRDYVETWFHDGAVATYVGELDGELAGFFMLQAPHEGDGTIDLIAVAVAPHLQSRGVGGTLLETCFAVARKMGTVDRMRLQVAEGNARAQRVFARRGFRMRPERGVYPAGQRALFMVKTLWKQEEGR